MKTDRFSDIIRRKLESIRPEFTEKDWVRMQATLHQVGMPQPGHTPTGHPFSGGIWSGGQSWLLAAASISTAALIGVGLWQHTQISDLRKTVAQLKQKVTTTQAAPVSSSSASPPVAQSPNQPVSNQPTAYASTSPSSPRAGTAPRRDTVYIDRYAMTPASPYLEKSAPGTERSKPAQSQSSPSVPKDYAATDRSLTPTRSLRRRNELTVSPQTDSYGISSTPLTSNQSTSTQPNGSVSADRPAYQSSQPERIANKLAQMRRESYAKATPPTNSGRSEPSQAVNEAPTPTTSQPTTVEQPDANATVSAASYESIASRPLTPQTVNWHALLAQQATRSMRPVKVVVVPPSVASVETKAPVSKPEKRIEHMGVRLRAGIGGEIASHLVGAGVYTETLLGKHWLVGVGLSQTTYNGRFVDDADFSEHTHRDFRIEVGQKVGSTILNIDARTTRLQIPLYLGYRIPLTASVAFLPTAGTYLNVTNTENTTYYVQTTIYNPTILSPPRITYQEGSSSNPRPVELINSLAFGTGIEWQQKHWVLQGSPVLTVPLQANTKPMQPEPNWQQNITLGFRARLLYQF